LIPKVEYHKNIIEQHWTKFKQDEYKFVKYLGIDDDMTEGEARQQAMYDLFFSKVSICLCCFVFFRKNCHEDKCDYLFVISSVAHIDRADTLIELMRYNKTIVAPMLVRPGKTWANFWGDFSDDGFYKSSPDYLEIINYNKM
jgi:hypothetical protein